MNSLFHNPALTVDEQLDDLPDTIELDQPEAELDEFQMRAEHLMLKQRNEQREHRKAHRVYG